MKIAIIGSRNLTVSNEEIRRQFPCEATEIISGGAKGIDSCARCFAAENGLYFTEILPDYRCAGIMKKSTPPSLSLPSGTANHEEPDLSLSNAEESRNPFWSSFSENTS